MILTEDTGTEDDDANLIKLGSVELRHRQSVKVLLDNVKLWVIRYKAPLASPYERPLKVELVIMTVGAATLIATPSGREMSVIVLFCNVMEYLGTNR